jgi:2-dehydro-3-deoxygluconokinase
VTAVDVLAVGEAMAVISPDPPVPLHRAATLRMSVAGAEANVVTWLAGLGLRTLFASRVGDDPFGRLILDTLAGAGVGAAVAVDAGARTGIYFKDPSGSGTRVHYYRAGSAACRLDATVWASCPPARLVHLSGITPALSDGCADLVSVGLAERPVPGATVSFDVNYRPALWRPDEAAPVLAALANQADVVFVGLDEAQALWGVASAAEVRTVLPAPVQLVVKDGPVGASLFDRDGVAFQPATPIEVVEPVGAGDAFAAGYLYGLLTGRAGGDRLRYGHLLASAALSTTADVGVPVTPADLLSASFEETR